MDAEIPSRLLLFFILIGVKVSKGVTMHSVRGLHCTGSPSERFHIKWIGILIESNEGIGDSAGVTARLVLLY